MTPRGRSVVATAARLVLALAVLTWVGAARAQPSPDDAADTAPEEAPSPADAPPADAPPADADVPTPDAAPEEAPPPPLPATDVPDVDIISSAGRREDEPPPRRPSLVTDGPKIRWDPSWKKFDLVDGVATGLFVATAIGTLAIPPTPGRWDDRNNFDVAVRNFLRPPRIEQQNTARDVSDVLLTLSINHLVVDSLVVAWWGYDADTVAFEMALMNVEAIAFNAAMNGLVAGLVSRQRPFAADRCVGVDALELDDCRSNNRYRSFFSGHASTTFTVAGLMCTHHMHLPLYGGGWPDWLACGTSFAMAMGTATMRVVGDKHWATDVLTGAAIGTFSGFALPHFLHYGAGEVESPLDDSSISVNVVPYLGGAQLQGAF